MFFLLDSCELVVVKGDVPYRGKILSLQSCSKFSSSLTNVDYGLKIS